MKSEPEYVAAKAGSRDAALDLVGRLISAETVNKVGVFARDVRPILLPVLAKESSGNNKIPLAMAEVLGHKLGLDVDHDIVQREKIGRTNASSDHRLVCNPTFDGPVKPGQFYLIVDDAVTMGGTVASLRGYVENRGGHVMAAAAMAARADQLDLRVSPDLLRKINTRHGPKMRDLAKEFTGHDLDRFTHREASHLHKAGSVDEMRTRLVEARDAAIGRVDAPRIGASLPSEVEGMTRAMTARIIPNLGSRP